MDVAGWWATAGEVEEDGQRLGWSEADVRAATFAWLEARRPAIQLLPNVAVPGEQQHSRVPTPLMRALSGGTALSTRELVPTELPVHPGMERYRPPRDLAHSGPHRCVRRPAVERDWWQQGPRDLVHSGPHRCVWRPAVERDWWQQGPRDLVHGGPHRCIWAS